MEQLNDANFDSVVRGNNFVLVDCFTVWCGPCKALTPTLEKFAAQHPNVKVYKLDVEKNTKISNRYNIMSVPTLLFFEHGQMRERVSSVLDLNSLKRKFGR